MRFKTYLCQHLLFVPGIGTYSLYGYLIFIPAGEWPNFEPHDLSRGKELFILQNSPHQTILGWAECDCGKYCTWSPCIQIFTNVSNEVFVLPEFYYIHGQCTFHNSSCPEGEDITTVLEELAKPKRFSKNTMTRI